MPIWALPSNYDAIGTLGAAARRFIDWMVAVGFRYWQTEPLGSVSVPEYGSPYSGDSGFAFAWQKVDPLELLAAGDLTPDDLAGYNPPPGTATRVDYQWLNEYKRPLLAKAFRGFLARADRHRRQSFKLFCEVEGAVWLDELAEFRSDKIKNGGKPWPEWPEHDTGRRARRRQKYTRAHRVPVKDFEAELECYMQWAFVTQMNALVEYAKGRIEGFFIDMPKFVGYDSADVRANPEQFRLDPCLNPISVSGMPPDFFNSEGQVWHHPHYDWEAAAADGYRWHIARMKHMKRFAALLRDDHALATKTFYAVPGDQFGLADASAEGGEWLPGPGEALYEAYLAAGIDMGNVVVEDVGNLEDDKREAKVRAMYAAYNLPGMRIARFIDSDFDTEKVDGHEHNPANHPQNCVAYLTTHDTTMARVWLEQLKSDDNPRRYNHLRHLVYGDWQADDSAIQWDAQRWMSGSEAWLAIFGLGDLLELGAEGNLNAPGVCQPENWSWRLSGFDELFTLNGEMRLTERSLRARDILVATNRA